MTDQTRGPMPLVEVRATLRAVADPREGQRMVSVRAKGPGSKSADGQSWSAMWLDVCGTDDAARTLAMVRKGDTVHVEGRLVQGREYLHQSGEVRQAGLTLWADRVAIHGMDGLEAAGPAPAPQPAYVDEIPF